MPDVAKKIIWSALLSIPSAIVGLVAQKVLQTWGVLSPFSEWLGGWLKMHVSPPQAGWTVAGIITLAAYATLLWLVWKRHRIPKANVGLAGISKQPSFSSQSSAVTQKDAESSDALDINSYMTVYEAINYLADDSEWGEGTRRIRTRFDEVPDGMRTNPRLVAQNEFKKIAERGVIHAIGRLNGEGTHVDIPERYWSSATIYPFSLHNPDISQTMPAVPNPDGIPVYKDVRILREDVERAWPVKGQQK
jgi:hypothetical protein